MHFFEKYSTAYLISFFLFLSLYSVTLFITGQTTTQWNYSFNIINALLYFSGGFIAFYGTHLYTFQSSIGRGLFFIGISLVSFALGLCIWAYHNLISKIEIPYPSLADIFFVLYIFFLGYGIINLLQKFGFLFSRRILIEAFAIFIGSAIFIFFFGNPVNLTNDTPFLAKAFNIFYLWCDSFLLMLGIMVIRVTKGKIHGSFGSFFFFIMALLLMALADFVFSYRTETGIYWNGDVADILYALSGLSFNFGITQTILVKLRTAKAPKSF